MGNHKDIHAKKGINPKIINDQKKVSSKGFLEGFGNPDVKVPWKDIQFGGYNLLSFYFNVCIIILYPR